MSVETLKMLSLVGFTLSIVFFLAGIVLFFILKIPRVFGEVTGVTEKKMIRQIQHTNEGATGRVHEISNRKVTSDKLTGKIQPQAQNNSMSVYKGQDGETQKFLTTELAPKSEMTTLLTNDLYGVDKEICYIAVEKIIE